MLVQLTTFVRIADAGNISRAARSLGLSVPMASRHLRWLEDELGVPLMRRTTHRLDLTDAGTELLVRARGILAGVEEAREVLRSGPGIAGRVVLSAPVSFGVHRLSPLLPSLFEKHPRLRVDVRLEDHVVDLLAEGVDVAIRASSGPSADSSSLVARRIGTYARLLCASPELIADKGPIESVAALAGVPCVVHRGASSWAFETPEGPEVVSVDGPLRTNNFLVVRDAVLAGLGVGWLPEYVVADDLRKRRLVRVLPGAALSAIELFGVYHQHSRGVAAVHAVLDHVARALRKGRARR
jgi:DNA-binding transcriptional LysR family regulator